MIILKNLIKKFFDKKNFVIFSAFSQYSYLNKGTHKVSSNRERYIRQQNQFYSKKKPYSERKVIKFCKNSEDDVMPKKTSKDISCVTNHLDDEVYLTLKVDNLNKDLLTRILNPESLNYSNLIELDTFEQALLIKSCQNKSKKNEYLLLLLPNEIYENYKEELKFENIRLEVEKYKDFEIPFEKNLEIINSILNLQNYYIEKYNLKSLKKNKKKE